MAHQGLVATKRVLDSIVGGKPLNFLLEYLGICRICHPIVSIASTSKPWESATITYASWGSKRLLGSTLK